MQPPRRPTTDRWMFRALIALLLSLPLTGRAAVWVATSSEKLSPSTGARTAPAATLGAARNEFEAFQIAVTADAGALQGVTATASALTGPGSLPAPRLFREAVINLANPSSADGSAGAWFDALVPDVDDVVGEKRNAFPFDVAAGQTQVVWVEFHVPADAPAGAYQGTVTVSAGGTALATVPVTLTVWGFALPSTSSLRTHFGLFYGELQAQHHVSGDAFYQLRARYAQLGLDHRISLGGIDDGVHDLNHFAQYYGPLLDGTAPTQLAGAKLTTVQFMDSPSTANFASWATFFRGKGWFDRLFDYTCDEPPSACAWSDITARNAAMKAADPEFRSLVTTSYQQATGAGVLPSIDLLVPVVNYLDGKGATDPGGWADTYTGLQRSKYDDFLSQPRKELWMYQSCMSHGCGGDSLYFTGWPSYMIDTASVRSRAEEWLSFAWGLTGELYWDTTWAYAYGDPWANQYQFSGNGDGNLFYPGTPAKIGGQTDIPVASIRLKMIREGMEDFEYLKLLSAAGDPGLAQQLATSLFPNAWTEPSASDLLAARDRIAARILELTGGGVAVPAGGSTGAAPGTGTGTGAGSGTGPATGSGAGATPGAGADAGGTSASPGAGGCSAGTAGVELLAAIGVLAALLVRRRRARA